jgi:hypothetical protein
LIDVSCTGELVLAQIDAARLAKLGDHPVDHDLIDVVSTEVRVAVRRDHLHDVVADLEDRDIERPAAEVVDGDDLVLLLVETIGEGSGGGLVDDPLHVETGDAPGVLGRLSLRIVEVRRDRDHRLGHLLTEIVLGSLLQLHQHLRADLLRARLLAANGERAVTVGRRRELVRYALHLA